jgi:membrane protein YdbS with pleckstrin-like domain
MKDFLKVFLLLISAFLFYLGLYLLKTINVFILSIIGITISVVVIVGIVLILRKKSHSLPKEKRKGYLEEYKNQFRKK